ncbi:SCP-like protein [Ancylostoma ceylanicum]|uniref:SCP-like protein n=1 Tax=Ancylostoma ceylanicum TaxID=53326 RepID=A0A0D6LJA0_9BILA|nr:SCP-like protein [Ancylostoma ceylanicum]
MACVVYDKYVHFDYCNTRQNAECRSDVLSQLRREPDAPPANGQPIYEKGTPCADPSQCTTYKESKCQSSTKLCRAGYPTNETVAPQPPVDDTSSTSTTTTETATTTPAKSKYCEKQEGMNTDAARKLFLDEHNKYRAATAKGEVKMGNGANARKCPNMKKLTAYDCDLEKAAYETAKNCPSTDPNTNNENWFVAATGNSEKEAAEQAMKSWYAEIEKSYMEQKTGSQNLLLLTLKINHFARSWHTWSADLLYGSTGMQAVLGQLRQWALYCLAN